MGKEWNTNKMACVILLFLLCVFPAKSTPVFTWGGYFIADNGGEPLSFTNPGRKALNVESANFRIKHIKSMSAARYNMVCVDNIRDYFSANNSAPNNNAILLPLYNDLGEVIGSINQQSNQLGIDNNEPAGAEIIASFSHNMLLRMYLVYRPFKSIPDAEYECAAYPMSGNLSDIKEITYNTLRITNLYTVAVPSISVDRTSLNLGSCQAGKFGMLSGDLLITLSHEGDHRFLKGSLTATVVGDTNDLSIRTAAGYNLVGTQPLEIGETAIGDYPLTVSVPCPNWAGTYQWRATLTYTIE